MNRKFNAAALAAAIACLLIARPSLAIPAPVSYWNFNNPENQNLGTFDGIVPYSGSTGYNLYVDHFTSSNSEVNPPGQIFFQNPTVVNANTGAALTNSDGTPAEHYQSGRTASYGKAYHMEGGINYQYYDTYPGGGDGDIDPQLDAMAAYPSPVQKYSWLDRLEIESTTPGQISPDVAGAFDSIGAGNGSITYSFWLNIKGAAGTDPDRFGGGVSFLVSRPVVAGQVAFKKVSGGGTVFNPYRYGLEVRNDCSGESGCTNGIHTVGSVLGNEWHHWVVQYDMTDIENGKASVWIDGGTANGGSQFAFTGMGAQQVVGRLSLNQVNRPATALQESGDFVIDDLAIFTGALLTNSDVTTLYQNTLDNIMFDPPIVYDVADTDKDGDVDTADLTTMFQNFTGDGGTGKNMSLGDTDMDGDVDTADIVTGFQHFTGALAGLANNPDIIYDPATGNVKIDADGANVGSFNLQSAGQFSGTANFADLAADTGFPSGPTDNTASAVGWVSGGSLFGVGFDGPGLADLGNILPTGLDLAGLTALLTNKAWAAPIGGGPGGNFDLVVQQVPEPGSLVLMALGVLGLFFVRRRMR